MQDGAIGRQPPPGLKILIIAGATPGLSVALFVLTGGWGDVGWVAGGASAFVVVALDAWGLWRLRRWALWLSWVLSAVAFIAGCMASQVRIQYRHAPTLWEWLDMWLPIGFLLLYPLIWVGYTVRPKVRALFRSDP